MTEESFVKKSLNLNLFFLRIMKEHSLFLAVAFQPHQTKLIQEALQFNSFFNSLLQSAVELSKGVLAIQDDAVTKYTLDAEKATSFLTAVAIDSALTSTELALTQAQINRPIDRTLVENVKLLNNSAIQATQSLINYKTKVLEGVLECKLFNANYPLLIDHIRREAILFVDLLTKLQQGECGCQIEELVREEIFWNRIMGEHTEFIRGLLDPSEEELMGVANNFAHQFKELTTKAYQALSNQSLVPQITNESLQLTKEVQNFKVQGTEGILQCKIRSLILPLLGDHVIREANHFILLIESKK